MPTSLPPGLRRRSLLAAGLAGAAVTTLPGCAGTAATDKAAAAAPAAAPAGAVLQPNANLFAQGITPVPMALVTKVAPYTEFRGHGFVDWHPQRDEMVVAHRRAGANTAQLFRVAAPLAEPEQLTDFADPVTEATFEPRAGKYLVFSRSSGGNEAYQLYRLDLDGRVVTPLTNPDERHEALGWLRGSGQLIHSSVPLDRTAQGGTRANPSTSIWILDPLKPEGRRKLAELPGVGWFGGVVARDDKQVAVVRYISANESQIWLLDVASGASKQLLPAAGETLRASHFPAAFAPDGKSLFLSSDRASEFRELMRLDLASGTLQRVSAHIPWDLSRASLSDDGSRIAATFNVDAQQELRLFDARSGKELPAPKLPAGSVSQPEFHPASARLAFALNSAQSPSQLFTLDTGGTVKQWTRAYTPPGIDTAAFPDQRIVRWKSFDGLPISGVLSMPPKRFKGPRPVIMMVHGGPEAQADLGFMGRWNYVVNELGIAIIQPNVRGSAGYGKSFLALDNGFKREDSVKDLGALLDWIKTQPELDASRVLVTGGSYGGYMSLATSVHYADRIAGAVDVVGISNFVTFLTNTESYRRDLRRVEYGDERDPAMREFLEKISPLNNAQKIRKPLFVVQGKNDPRVPVTEAEQIVAKVRAQGTPVWYLRAENEGHGFARKENADYQFYATVGFLEQTLLR
ncbi:S9 family peptidase [Rivibacter subsaxonicus]|uniref:Dipeptidyl aminopeptidase/acylaminoacyl peptidase n=1 Tax=Rivibacter subsaxonicus TaxID=457575 RepID=A0A4Q7W177_9BURK|nr:prolyl oligopeptidase family serine peptidase [Rivibacter subsaxonicus]RZU02967.1 dipeptidyl aminopeptidase/acylaminoacyl peptidase [Rivibacter subsaxonicus]